MRPNLQLIEGGRAERRREPEPNPFFVGLFVALFFSFLFFAAFLQPVL